MPISVLILIIIVFFFPSTAYAWLQTYEVSPDRTYGFFSGLWHGIIAPFAVFAQLFDNDIILYSPVNSGFGYNIGFLIGIAVVIGGGASGVNSNREGNETKRDKRKA